MNAADKRSRRWWATVGVGAVACSACCVLAPMLIAVGFVGGGSLLASLHWLEPVGFALIAVGVLGVVATRVRARRQRRRGSGACSATGDSSCGCAMSAQVTAQPSHRTS